MRLKIYDIQKALGVSNSYDIVNAIRNSATEEFRQYVPLANAENVAEVGAGILINQTIQNQFITALVDRIGKVVIKQKLLENPLRRFKKGMLPLGRTIEEVFVDITEEKMYDVEEAETTVFKREIPDVKTLFHELNRKGYYKQTVQDSDLTTAFISWSDFDSLLVKIVSSMYNSSEVDEFKYMKLLVDNYMAKGHFKVLQTELTSSMNNEVAIKQTVKDLRSLVTRMTLESGSRDFNSMGVHTRSDRQSLKLLVTPEFEATMDVDVLAQAFNMEKATLLSEIIVVDSFATPGLLGVLVDEDFFMVYDKLIKMETIRNPQGLYWNYFLHIWQVLSASRFENAVAFVSKDYDTTELEKNDYVTEIIMNPQIASTKPGSSFTVEAQPRMVIGATVHPVPDLTYVVSALDGTPLAEGTGVVDNGLSATVNVGATQTGTLLVTAKPVKEGATVTGTMQIIVQ